MTEIELKLELTDAGAVELESSGLFGGAPAVSDQSSIYFDTPKLHLAAAGLTLRLRDTGGRWVQTVKSADPGSAGLFARSEWEQPVAEGAPVLDEGTPVAAVLGDKAQLAPAFEAQIERRTWLVREGEAEIEAVLDRGDVISGERRSHVAELELELKRGGVDSLFVLARKVNDIAAVRLGVLSKAERGYRLARPALGKVKAETVALPLQASAGEAFQHIAQSCLRQFRLNEDLLLAHGGVESLHQARVALRRLRSAFSIFAPLIRGDEVGARLREELRWLAAELGAVRDLDVMLGRPELGAVHEHLAQERAETFDRVKGSLESQRARSLMLELVAWLVDGEWLRTPSAELRDQPARHFAATALRRLRKRVKKRGGSLETIDDETRHEVRKDAKKLRYGAEFFERLYPGKRLRRHHKRFVDALAELQDQLGALNDLATAPEVLEKLGLAAEPAEDDSRGDGKQALVAAAAQAHSALMERKRFWDRGEGEADEPVRA